MKEKNMKKKQKDLKKVLKINKLAKHVNNYSSMELEHPQVQR